MKRFLKPMMLAVALIASTATFAQTPRPEYPRPQFERNSWVNLNGKWSYSFDFGQTGDQKGWTNSKGFDDNITVPFCPESKLSGVQHTDFINAIWYQRTLNIPAEWNGKRINLNFGASDYETHVYVDGHLAGTHYGSGSSFSLDITKLVQGGGAHNLVVWVKDNLRDGLQTGGKQCFNLRSEGCSYTRTTGIWQTVWMEAVDKEGLESVYAVPDIDQKQLVVHPRFYSENADNQLRVKVMDGNKTVATKTVVCANDGVVVLPINGMKLWSPESPFLYTVTYEVLKSGKVIDKVDSYAGMRKVSIQNGHFCLNNKPYFQVLVLDQGFYPDGIWTAPTDEALKNDIAMSKAVGFTGARLHQKSFEERYYYWADKLGYLTWSESASWGLDINNELAARNFIGEWTELVERDRNHPSVVTWTPFNETWGCSDSGVYTRLVNDVYRITKAIDATRPVNDASGDGHVKTDIWSIHDYARADGLLKDMVITPGKEPYRNQGDKKFLANYDGQPYMLDEWGGLGWIKPEARSNSWGYGAEIKTLDEFYKILQGEVEVIVKSKAVDGVCYTQITDVEQEKNGIYYYDRTPKFDTKRIRQIFDLFQQRNK